MPPAETHIVAITHAIQLAIAPVFLLTAIGTIINALTGRLARAVDRRRAVEQREHDLGCGGRGRGTAVAPGTRDAFGEIGPDEKARPLEGVAARVQHAAQRSEERKRLEDEPRAAGMDRSERELPREREK